MALRQPQRTLLLAFVAIFVIGGLILTTITHSAALNRQLHSWKLLPEPERLTELYFTDHVKLPTRYIPGQTQTVGFTVHNLEYRTVTYQYHIIQTDRDSTSSQELASGQFTLPQNGYQKTNAPVTLTDIGARAAVSVVLSGGQQTIKYLVTRG